MLCPGGRCPVSFDSSTVFLDILEVKILTHRKVLWPGGVRKKLTGKTNGLRGQRRNIFRGGTV